MNPHPKSPATAGIVPPCPDPLTPDAPRALYAAFYRRLWALAHDARSTNYDVTAGFTAARLAARVGAEPEVPKELRVDLASLLTSSAPRPENADPHEADPQVDSPCTPPSK